MKREEINEERIVEQERKKRRKERRINGMKIKLKTNTAKGGERKERE